jgi:hypothetical protein
MFTQWEPLFIVQEGGIGLFAVLFPVTFNWLILSKMRRLTILDVIADVGRQTKAFKNSKISYINPVKKK